MCLHKIINKTSGCMNDVRVKFSHLYNLFYFRNHKISRGSNGSIEILFSHPVGKISGCVRFPCANKCYVATDTLNKNLFDTINNFRLSILCQ